MMFTPAELRIMDAPTADGDIVLASLGGKPRMPGDKYEEGSETMNHSNNESSNDTIARKEDDRLSAAECGVPSDKLKERDESRKDQ